MHFLRALKKIIGKNVNRFIIEAEFFSGRVFTTVEDVALAIGLVKLFHRPRSGFDSDLQFEKQLDYFSCDFKKIATRLGKQRLKK